MVAPGGRAAAQADRSAERVAHERAALAEQQRRVHDAEAQHRAWLAGAAGERATATALEELTADGWRFLHDVRWPGRQRANLDHVAVGPGGVVVVDSKNWSTPAHVSGGVLRAGRHLRARECEDVARASAALAPLLPERGHVVRGALCLVQQDLAPVAVDAGVVVVGLPQLAALLRDLPEVLTPHQVGAAHAHLAARLAWPSASGTPRPPGRVPAPRRRSAPAGVRPRGAVSARRRSARSRTRPMRPVVGLLLAAGLAWGFSQWLRSWADVVGHLTLGA